MKRLLLLTLLLTLSHGRADTPTQIFSDYRRQAAVAVENLNHVLERNTTALVASLVASGDTTSAEQLAAQLKAKQAGEAVPAPHSSAALLFAQYDQARSKALGPAQKSAISRIEAMLKNRADLKIDTVTELAKIRAEIEAENTSTPAANDAGSSMATTRLPSSAEVPELVQKLGGSYTKGSDGAVIDLKRAALSTEDLLAIGTDKRIKSFNWSSGKGLSDEGMAAFAGMKKLDYLFLWASGKITDAGLKHLADCERLDVLNIGGNGEGITGTGFESLAQCKVLRRLTLNYLSKLDGQNLRHLAGLKSLKLLYLSSCKRISDADLDLISQMTQLTELDLANTAVTDAGLAKLTTLKDLQELIVSGPLVTKAGVEVLTKARPRLHVTFAK